VLQEVADQARSEALALKPMARLEDLAAVGSGEDEKHKKINRSHT
jgi:hypothetical protein